jgi:hypothetical protein
MPAINSCIENHFPLKQFAFQGIASKTSIEIKRLLVQVL